MSQKLQRNFKIDRADIDDDNRTVKLSFSSEDPYERYFGDEILDHKASSVNLERLNDGGPLLLNHNTDKQIGVIENASISRDKKGKALVRFSTSQLAEEIYNDVRDGIRKNVSVGYQVNKMVLEESDQEKDVYRVTDWMPLEVSIVAVPADNTVGVGRELEEKFSVEEFIKLKNNEVKTQCINLNVQL